MDLISCLPFLRQKAKTDIITLILTIFISCKWQLLCSADILCKQFRPISGLTECGGGSLCKPCDAKWGSSGWIFLSHPHTCNRFLHSHTNFHSVDIIYIDKVFKSIPFIENMSLTANAFCGKLLMYFKECSSKISAIVRFHFNYLPASVFC